MHRIFAILCLVFATPLAGQEISKIAVSGGVDNKPIRFVLDGMNEETTLAVARLSETQREELLRVYIVSGPGAKIPEGTQPIFGKYEWSKGALSFESRYPASPGATYRAVSTLPGSKSIASLETTIPKKKIVSTTKITTIYPTADVLPENLLKFYVHFSAPMSTGEAYKHISLETSSGEKIVLPFLEIAEELWDKTNTRLTLLLDPGRIKRGLVPREEDGPILVAGQAYRFRVMADWPDAEGAPLVGEVVKGFKVSGQDTTQPAPTEWKIVAPRAGSKSPIVIDLLEPLDHAIVTRGIRVFDAKGNAVEGEVTLARQEREWRFTPGEAWKAGSYELSVDDVIEDLVGNNVTRPFELDRFDEVKAPEEKKVRLKIEIR